MTNTLLRRLLGGARQDSGCDAAFGAMERYVEVRLAGTDVERAFPEVAAHLERCPDCREDVDGLLAAARRT
jgi:hypothetical protein